MAHGERNQLQALRDYVHTEMMALAVKCDRLESDLVMLQRRLDSALAMVDRAMKEDIDTPT